MAGGYPFLNGVRDPKVYQALKAAWDQILATQAGLTTLQGTAVTVSDGAPLDAQGQRVINVGTPEAAADAVPLNYLKAILQTLATPDLVRDAIVQATSKATGVTLTAQAGDITLNAANLAAATTVAFVLTNPYIQPTSVLTIAHISGGTVGSYTVTYTPAIGSATITVRNITAGALAEAIVLRFLIVPGT